MNFFSVLKYEFKNTLLNILLAAAVCFFLYQGLWKPQHKKMTYDFGCYYNGAREILKDKPDLYKPVIYRKTDFGYLPVVAILFIPLTLFKLQVSFRIWNLLNVIIIGMSIYVLHRIFRKKISKNQFKIMTGMLLIYNPVLETLRWGQSNIPVLLFLLLFIYFYQIEKKKLSGFFLGLAVTIKLIPGLIIIFLLFKKKFKIVIAAFIVILVLNISAVSYAGLDMHIEYITKKIPELNRTAWRGNPYNNSFHSLFYRLFNPDTPFAVPVKNLPVLARYLTTITSLIILVTSLTVVFFKRKIKGYYGFFLQLSLIMIAGHLFNNLTWEHHFTLIIFCYFIAMLYTYKEKLRLEFVMILLSYVLVAFKYGYDSKLFSHGLLTVLASVKLFSVLLLWLILLRLIYHRLPDTGVNI